MVDTDTRQAAVERLMRAVVVFTVGIVLLGVALLLALIIGAINITLEATVAGRAKRAVKLTDWFVDKSDRIMQWFADNVMYIAGGGSRKPDLLP